MGPFITGITYGDVDVHFNRRWGLTDIYKSNVDVAFRAVIGGFTHIHTHAQTHTHQSHCFFQWCLGFGRGRIHQKTHLKALNRWHERHAPTDTHPLGPTICQLDQAGCDWELAGHTSTSLSLLKTNTHSHTHMRVWTQLMSSIWNDNQGQQTSVYMVRLTNRDIR